MRGVACPVGERELLMKLHQQGLSFSVLSRKTGIRREVLYRWWKRYKEQGRVGLEPHARRPRRSPGQLPGAIDKQVLHLRKRGWGTHSNRLGFGRGSQQRSPHFASPWTQSVARAGIANFSAIREESAGRGSSESGKHSQRAWHRARVGRLLPRDKRPAAMQGAQRRRGTLARQTPTV